MSTHRGNDEHEVQVGLDAVLAVALLMTTLEGVEERVAKGIVSTFEELKKVLCLERHAQDTDSVSLARVSELYGISLSGKGIRFEGTHGEGVGTVSVCQGKANPT